MDLYDGKMMNEKNVSSKTLEDLLKAYKHHARV
jgi:hypothetical protein